MFVGRLWVADAAAAADDDDDAGEANAASLRAKYDSSSRICIWLLLLNVLTLVMMFSLISALLYNSGR